MELTLAGVWQALEGSAMAVAIRQSSWLYPVLEIVHLVGIVLLVGAAFLFDLRLLGLSVNLPVKGLAHHLLPWSRRGFGLVVPSGVLLFSTNAVALAADPVFHTKLIVLGVAGMNAGLFHRYLFPAAPAWDFAATPILAKVVAVFSILAWLTVIACGRLLAY